MQSHSAPLLGAKKSGCFFIPSNGGEDLKTKHWFHPFIPCFRKGCPPDSVEIKAHGQLRV